MYCDNDIFLEGEEELIKAGVSVQLRSCECPQTTTRVDLNAATECRLLTIPVRISNLCPNKEFILFVTVCDSNNVKIGQVCRSVTRTGNSCGTTDIDVTLVIKKPVCSTDTIRVDVKGNYTNICNVSC